MNRIARTLLKLVGLLMCPAVWAANTITYTYDDLNRLTAVVRSDGPTMSYSYDEAGNVTARSATNPDTDGDGLTDISEINVHGTDPILTDTDSDGLSDGAEVNTHGTDPVNADTDGDGASDGAEVAAGTDPLDPSSFPTVATGDINADGVVNLADVILADRIVLGLHIPTAEELARGDVAPLVNGLPQPDGGFDLGDAIVIRRKALGEVSF